MKVKLSTDRSGSLPTFDFEIVDTKGRKLWGGHGFISDANRTDAIKVAKRSLLGLEPGAAVTI